MTKFVVEYGNVGKPPEPDGRLDGPAFHRNHDAIWSAMAGFLSGRRPETYWRSAVGPGSTRPLSRVRHRTSPGGRAIFTHRISPASRPGGGTRALQTCARRSASTLPIPLGLGQRTGKPAANSPPSSASTCCTSRPGGWRKTSSPAPDACCATAAGCSSTARSCATARIPRRAMPPSTPACGRKIPEWGVRDLADLNALAQDAGLTAAEIVPMPANNLVLAFARALRQN